MTTSSRMSHCPQSRCPLAPPLTLTSSTFLLLLCSFLFSVKDEEMHLDGSVKSILHNPSVCRWFNKSISFIFRWNQEWNIPILESFPSLCCVFSPRCANAVYNAERCISQLASPPSHLLLCVHRVCLYTHVCLYLATRTSSIKHWCGCTKQVDGCLDRMCRPVWSRRFRGGVDLMWSQVAELSSLL